MVPYVVALYEETGLSAAFGVRLYGKVYFDTALYGLACSMVLTPLSRWAPAHCTSTGKVLLAYGSESPAKRNSRPLTRYTDNTITNPDVLAAELGKVRRTGVAVSRGEYIDDLTSFAAPVFGRRLRLNGALAVCGRSDEVDPRPVTLALRRLARAASSAARMLD
jgi:DNA-binding IclR family transcriptional regulator